MELRQIREGSPELEKLERINREAFPDSERLSMEELLRTGADGNLEILGIYTEEDREPAGFAVIRKYRRIRYLAYLAVRNDLRSRGIGSRALRALTAGQEGTQTVVEYESPEVGGDREMKLRRKQFYLRNGFFETEWVTAYGGNVFEIGCSEPDYDAAAFDEFTAYLATIATTLIPKQYRKGETE